jgi:hypothetical protein
MTDRPLTIVQKLSEQVRAAQPNQLFALASAKLFRLVGPRLTSKLRIFRFDPAVNGTHWPEGFVLHRFSCIEEVPEDIVAQISALGLEKIVAANFSEGADLWLGIGRGRLAISLWTVRRALLRQWHVPIEPEDIILYSVVTQPAFRGLGLAGSAAGEIWRRQGDKSRSFYVDCKLWNRTAQRAFIKAGFTPVATASPAPEEFSVKARL